MCKTVYLKEPIKEIFEIDDFESAIKVFGREAVEDAYDFEGYKIPFDEMLNSCACPLDMEKLLHDKRHLTEWIYDYETFDVPETKPQ